MSVQQAKIIINCNWETAKHHLIEWWVSIKFDCIVLFIYSGALLVESPPGKLSSKRKSNSRKVMSPEGTYNHQAETTRELCYDSQLEVPLSPWKSSVSVPLAEASKWIIKYRVTLPHWCIQRQPLPLRQVGQALGVSDYGQKPQRSLP